MEREIVCGMDIITKAIAEQAEEESAKILEKAQAEAAVVSMEYEKKANAVLLAAKEKAKKESALSYERAVSAAANHKRNALLFQKGALVEEAFAKALLFLESLGKDEYYKLLSNLLLRVWDEYLATERLLATYAGEDFVKATELSLVMAKRDEALGRALCEGLSKKLATEKKTLVLAEADENIGSGFVLIAGDIRMDCSLKRLVYSQKASLEGEVYRILFAKGEGYVPDEHARESAR